MTITREEMVEIVDSNVFWSGDACADPITIADKIVDRVLAFLRSDPGIPKRAYERWTLALADTRNGIEELVETAVKAATAEVDVEQIADEISEHLRPPRKPKGGKP